MKKRKPLQLPKAIKALFKIDITWLNLFTFMLGLFIQFIIVFIIRDLFNIEISDNGYSLIYASGTFIAGLVGVEQLLKGEAPGFLGKPIKGIFAFFSGIMYILFFWSLTGILLLIGFNIIDGIF